MPDTIKNLTPTFDSVIKQALTNRLKDVHTAMPGIIVAFNGADQIAQVQPAIRRIFSTGDQDVEILTPADLPVLINVPVIFPQGGGFSLTFPVGVGDECLILFAERSIDNWHESGGVQNPQAWRMHNLSDAICFVGMNSKPKKISNFDPTNVQLRDESGVTNFTIRPDQKIEINVPVELIVNAPLTTWTGDIDLTGDITQTGNFSEIGIRTLTGSWGMTGTGGGSGTMTLVGDISQTGGQTVSGNVTASGISLNSHTHGGVEAGGDSTSGPQ